MSKHITGHTGLLCLLGSPVAHSVSPEMHNEACDQLGLDYSYLAFDVPDDKMPQAVEGLRTMGARGWNITMPGKNIMCRLADKVSPASEISGACNTIVNDNGVLTAYTTDGVGFMRAVAAPPAPSRVIFLPMMSTPFSATALMKPTPSVV